MAICLYYRSSSINRNACRRTNTINNVTYRRCILYGLQLLKLRRARNGGRRVNFSSLFLAHEFRNETIAIYYQGPLRFFRFRATCLTVLPSRPNENRKPSANATFFITTNNFRCSKPLQPKDVQIISCKQLKRGFGLNCTSNSLTGTNTCAIEPNVTTTSSRCPFTTNISRLIFQRNVSVRGVILLYRRIRNGMSTFRLPTQGKRITNNKHANAGNMNVGSNERFLRVSVSSRLRRSAFNLRSFRTTISSNFIRLRIKSTMARRSSQRQFTIR